MNAHHAEARGRPRERRGLCPQQREGKRLTIVRVLCIVVSLGVAIIDIPVLQRAFPRGSPWEVAHNFSWGPTTVSQVGSQGRPRAPARSHVECRCTPRTTAWDTAVAHDVPRGSPWTPMVSRGLSGGTLWTPIASHVGALGIPRDNMREPTGAHETLPGIPGGGARGSLRIFRFTTSYDAQLFK